MRFPIRNTCQTRGTPVLPLLLFSFGAFAAGTVPIAASWKPPAPTTQPDDENKARPDDRDDAPPLGGPRRDRPRRFRPDGPPPGPGGDEEGDRPPNFRGPRDGRGRRPFGPEGEGPGEGRRGMFPPRREGQPGGPPPPPPPPLPPEVMQELEKIIRDEMPELFKRMERWRELHPDRFDQAMAKFYPSLREYMMLRESEPKLAAEVLQEMRIEIQLRRLSLDYREAAESSPQRAEIEGKMNELVRQQVDIRLRRRVARIRVLEERLQLEKQRLEADQAKVNDLYKDRLEQVKRGQFEDLFPQRPGLLKPRQGPRGADGEGPPDREGPEDREVPGPRDHEGPGPDGPPPDDDNEPMSKP